LRSPLNSISLGAKVEMKRLLALALLGLAGLLSASSEAVQPSESALRSSFGSLSSNIAIRTEHGQRVLEYCPDNTCERFVAPASSSQQALANFAFLYLYKVSGYFYLAEFKKTEAAARAKSLVSRHSRRCPQPEELNAVACLLRFLQHENHIRISFTRQDEGQVSVVPVSLEEELRRAGAK
jgi:hypothetical protein